MKCHLATVSINYAPLMENNTALCHVPCLVCPFGTFEEKSCNPCGTNCLDGQ